MPSLRKRIGYLPSINAQETIIKIANKEKLSQSKVVGILVEEALIARRKFKIKTTNDLAREDLYKSSDYIDKHTFKYNDLDELISDKGITYNTKNYQNNLEINKAKPSEKDNEELFEQFKQFILFQKFIQN